MRLPACGKLAVAWGPSKDYIPAMFRSRLDPDRRRLLHRPRFRAIPVRTLLPNIITLLALCAGLTAIRLAVEDRLEWAVAAIVFAALLDGIDGRVARMLKGTSRFGAELDSLADFVNFVGAPAPAGAITVLLPIYVYFLGVPRLAFVTPVVLVYTLAIAFLMVSRLP